MRLIEIDSRAVVHPKAELGDNVVVAPFAIISENVTVGNNSCIGPSVFIDKNVSIGEDNKIYNGTIIGTPPQDNKYKDTETYVEIGNNNIIIGILIYNGSNQFTVVCLIIND